MNTLRTTHSSTFALSALILLSLTGCKYDGSFFNMSSNSGSPFFGLQWAVDSGSRPPKSNQEKATDNSELYKGRLSLKHEPYAAIPDLRNDRFTSQSTILRTRSAAVGRKQFEATSESRELNTDVRYSLQSPVSDVSLRTENIDQRLSAF